MGRLWEGSVGEGWGGYEHTYHHAINTAQSTHELAKVKEQLKNAEKDKKSLDDKVDVRMLSLLLREVRQDMSDVCLEIALGFSVGLL